MHFFTWCVAVIAGSWLLVGSSVAHPIAEGEVFGDNNHPHFLEGESSVLETAVSCSGEEENARSKRTADDEEMAVMRRGSKSSGNCTHVTERVNLGPGITGENITVNRSMCVDNSTGFSALNDSGLCYARKTVVERITLANGTVNLKSAKFCKDLRVTEQRNSCRRLNKTEVHYLDVLKRDSMLINVGHCGGTCENGGSCKEIAGKDVSVPGPNGDESVHVISECGCVSNCYRMSHYELYRVTTDDERCIEKRVDVGQCVGECGPSCRRPDTPWGPGAGVPFAAGTLPCQKPTCTASSYHMYLIEEAKVEIPVINKCNCLVNGYIVDSFTD